MDLKDVIDAMRALSAVEEYEAAYAIGQRENANNICVVCFITSAAVPVTRGNEVFRICQVCAERYSNYWMSGRQPPYQFYGRQAWPVAMSSASPFGAPPVMSFPKAVGQVVQMGITAIKGGRK